MGQNCLRLTSNFGIHHTISICSLLPMNNREAGSFLQKRFPESRSRSPKVCVHQGLGQCLNKQNNCSFRSDNCGLRWWIVQPRLFQCCSAAAANTAEQQLIRRKNKKLLKQAEQRYTWGSQKNGKSSGKPQKLSLVVKKQIRDWKNPLRAILLWVKIWVRRFYAEIQN